MEDGTFPWAMAQLLDGKHIQRRAHLQFNTFYCINSGGELMLVNSIQGGAAEEVFNGDDVLATDWCVVVSEAQQKLARGIEIAQELIDGPGNNPDYFAAWVKTQAQWQDLYDSEAYEEGMEAVQARLRKCFTECADWAEAKEPYMDGPWSKSAHQFAQYLKEVS